MFSQSCVCPTVRGGRGSTRVTYHSMNWEGDGSALVRWGGGGGLPSKADPHGRQTPQGRWTLLEDRLPRKADSPWKADPLEGRHPPPPSQEGKTPLASKLKFIHLTFDIFSYFHIIKVSLHIFNLSINTKHLPSNEKLYLKFIFCHYY